MGNTLQTFPKTSPPQQQEPRLSPATQLPSPPQEFTCEICIEPTSNPRKKFNNANKCSHPFCTDCIIKYIRVKLEDDNTGYIKCPALNCNHALDPFSCSSLVGPPLFLRWTDVLCEAAIGDRDKCYCPYRNCNELIVNECGGNPKKSKCPSCKRWFCFQCKRVWHSGFRCDESGELRDMNDVTFGRLVEERKWMRCPQCRHFVELRDGCQIIKCRCGISFCYKCGKQANQHWCRCVGVATCCGWCSRFLIVLLVLTAGFFVFVLGIGNHDWLNH